MSPQPMKGTELVVAIDFAQPESYLALGPTLDLAAELGIELDWQPLCTPQRRPPPAEREVTDRGTRHLRFRALYQERDLARYAAAQGLRLGSIHRGTDPTLAALGLSWVKEYAREQTSPEATQSYVRETFARYWNQELDIEDVEAIRGLLDELGLPGHRFVPADLGEAHVRLQEDLRAAGMLAAPGYLLGEEFFLGRAHLPMIRWLLSGKKSPPPI